jgi:transglutaminase-like putative cysteine protease
MLLRIVHHTRYRYQAPVLLAKHLAHLRPLDRPGQRVLQHQLAVSPEPAQLQQGADAFGNWRTFFALQSAHEALDVSADSLVQTTAHAALPASPPWESVRDGFRYQAGARYEPASEFVFPSPYVPLADAFADFARPLFTPGRPLLDACRALTGKIHRELRYESASTEVNTPALEALAQGRGVCQDFAHIMIACLRSLGLAARYVSGYLLTRPPPGQARLIGADASHAWVSVWCTGAWHDFDPTNDRCGHPSPGEDYVTLSLGRDFGDVSPLRGVIQGGGAHCLQVEVTVAPSDEYARLAAPGAPALQAP